MPCLALVLFVALAAAEAHRPLLSGADDYTSPRRSPDGDRLACVSSAAGRGPQLYVRWMAGQASTPM